MIWSRRHWLLGSLWSVGLSQVPSRAAEDNWAVVRRPASHDLAAEAQAYELVCRRGFSQIDLTVVVFDRNLATLRVIDAPSLNVRNASDAAVVADAIAVVNGGYFDPQFEPVGLQMTNDQATGQWVGTSSLLGGAVAVRDQTPLLLWRAEVAEPQSFSDLIQAGPRLVHNRQPINGFRNDQARPRTFIATDSADRWAIGIARRATLKDLAELLATPGILPDVNVNRALNLDGGRSSSLWFTSNTGVRWHHPHSAKVRNYLALVPALRPERD